ncbi:PREDICTED: probable receptor-like protein kinase At1g33260 [Ipomoea nil]|uniref:probable receptor-like protein kinase At1g33260 n=1 Tax=Ipomoea nil TaxID=35883 RepID=UPI000900FE79|nr:PREDICTED: probable receptor-like protein kinase At1g33260 [Ipomoea nil]
MAFGCLGRKSRRRKAEKDTKESARRLTRKEVQKLTVDFSRSRVIAFGGFSTVYLGKFPDSSLGAIKIIDTSSKRLHTMYKQELEILQRIRHDNIVKVLGYSDDEGVEEGVLVFEYVPNGTLQEKLHGNGGGSVLPWRNRMGIAFQLAQVLEYLHDKCDPQIVHGDLKGSNILLDSELNCKLCDYGSAKMGFSSTVQPPSSTATATAKNRTMMTMFGSPGYTDPHYLRTGIATKKSDIYSLGVILLELITGLEAVSSDSNVRLISKAGPMLKDESKVAGMVDRRLAAAGEFEVEEAKAMASIAALCLGDSPSLRPTASDILGIMRSKVPSIGFLFSTKKC